jgi:hypothetical protein
VLSLQVSHEKVVVFLIEYGPAGERGHTMEERKRRRLTAKRKFEIYLETKKEGAKIGEILRREGIHLNDSSGLLSCLHARGHPTTTRKLSHSLAR